MLHDICELLRGNLYPGRGIIIGRSYDNKKAVIVYFIMGRSENSRNRVFSETEDGIKTEAYEPSKMTDPSLVIYHPVRCVVTGDGPVFIVTNGDQTDTLREYLFAGKSYVEALMTREFEPDAPNYTPRISGLLFPCGSYMLSILKATDHNPACCLRHFFTYDSPQPGAGHFIHTYTGDGAPLPSFIGEPVPVEIPPRDLNTFADELWLALNEENKVSLYVSEIDLASGNYISTIINKNT